MQSSSFIPPSPLLPPSLQEPSAMANLVELAEELGARTPFTGGEEEELEQRRQGGPS